MMTFYFKSGKKSYYKEDEQKAKDYFLKVVGELKNEFDENNVFVEVSMDSNGCNKKYIFNSLKEDIGILVGKLQEYRKINPL